MIVTSDHGEGLGEHDLFDHGESLYRTEIRVPLLIVVPSAQPVSRGCERNRQPSRCAGDHRRTRRPGGRFAVSRPVAGQAVAGIYIRSGSATIDGVVSELTGPNPADPNQGRSPANRGPLVSLAEGDFVYIRNEGDGAEEFFNERDDPRELLNRAGVEAMQPVLERFRERLNQLKARP